MNHPVPRSASFFIFILCISTISYLSSNKFFANKKLTLTPKLILIKSPPKLHWLNSDVTIIEPEELLTFTQKDSKLVNYIRARHLSPPSKLLYNLNGNFTKAPKDGAAIAILRKIFRNTTNGFFVECGAYNGIESRTLFLEREFGWSGLLIECNPVSIPELRKVKRKAYTADVCLSGTETPEIVNITSMDKWPAFRSIEEEEYFFPQSIPLTSKRFEVSAFPIYSIIAATGTKVVDLIVLDVQCAQWKVISNFPFEAIFVKAWNVGAVYLTPGERESLKTLMKLHGYRDPIQIGLYTDYLFVHSSTPLDPSVYTLQPKDVPPMKIAKKSLQQNSSKKNTKYKDIQSRLVPQPKWGKSQNGNNVSVDKLVKGKPVVIKQKNANIINNTRKKNLTRNPLKEKYNLTNSTSNHLTTSQSKYHKFEGNMTVYGNYILVNTSKNSSRPELPPILLSANGGIGNQLFEFACVYSIAKKRNSDLYLTAPSKDIFNIKHSHQSYGRPFSLNHFKIPFDRYSNETFKNYNGGALFEFMEQNIWENDFPKDRVLVLRDVCPSEYYFKEFREEIKEMFQISIDESPIQKILDDVAKLESVSVHVRRGDYSSKTENRSLPITFQKRAIKWMKKMVSNATFFVFSDDLKFAKKEFAGIANVMYIDNSNKTLASLYDFLIMSRCKHNIIANSTFCWWAAYLNRNKDKIVIAPLPRHPPGWNENMYKNKNQFKYRELIYNNYLYPNEWLTFNPFEY